MHPTSQRWILTGPIGSGKSTVGRLLTEQGLVVIDADLIGHDILRPGGPAYESVAHRWPEVLRDGHIDRRLLGQIVFKHPDELRELESLTHPHIRRRIMDLDREHQGSVLVVELPVLDKLSLGWKVIVVDAPIEMRKARLRDRGMTADEISDRMGVQPPRDVWIGKADLVIDNSGSLSGVTALVESLLPVLRNGVIGDDPQYS